MRRRAGGKVRIGDYYLDRRPDSPFYYIVCRRRGRELNRSTGTPDPERAEEELARFVTLHGERRREDPRNVPLAVVAMRYYEHHAKHLASADQNRKALAAWSEFFPGARVADLTRARQDAFEKHLIARRLQPDTIRRYFEIGKAALNWACANEELTGFPPIKLPPKGEPRRWIPSFDEFVRLWDAAEAPHLQMFIVLAINTLARPGAVLGLTTFQCDLGDGLIRLNPEGRRQTAKFRATVPMTRSVRPWVAAAPPGPLVRYRGRPVKSIKRVWNETRARAGLDPRFQPRVLRKMMAKELRRRGVPKWDVEGVMGHSSGSQITEDHYAQYEPEYLSRVVDAIDTFVADVGRVAARPIVLPQTICVRTGCVPGA